MEAAEDRNSSVCLKRAIGSGVAVDLGGDRGSKQPQGRNQDLLPAVVVAVQVTEVRNNCLWGEALLLSLVAGALRDNRGPQLG